MNEVPIDPDVVQMLGELMPPTASPVAAADLTAEQHRQGGRAAMEFFTRDAATIDVDEIVDTVAPGRDGDVPVRVYSPASPAGVIVFMHGGAWMTGSIDMSDHAMRRLSRDTGTVVVSVEYRMVPEHPFPAPLDDAYDTVVWASTLHPELPLLVAGDSAGGTLAAAITLRARDEGGPQIDGQVLVYPGIDDDLDAPSMLAFGDDVPNSREDLRFLLWQYAGQGAAAQSPLALPGRAGSLAGLPPALVAIAGHDRLRSSEERYAQRLREDGVPVLVQTDLELTHAWFDYAPRVPAADRAFTRLTDHVRVLLGRAEPPR